MSTGDDLLVILRTMSGVLCAADVATAALRALAPAGAAVAPTPGETVPGIVRIPLPDGTGLTLETLRAAFGPAQELPRLHRKAPVEHLFTVDDGASPYTVAIIADVANGAVQAVTLRRDMRLE